MRTLRALVGPNGNKVMGMKATLKKHPDSFPCYLSGTKALICSLGALVKPYGD